LYDKPRVGLMDYFDKRGSGKHTDHPGYVLYKVTARLWYSKEMALINAISALTIFAVNMGCGIINYL